MDLKKLRKRLGEAVDAMEALTRADEWTDESRSEFDKLKAEVEQIRADIARGEALETEKANADSRAGSQPNPGNVGGIEMGDAPEDRKFPSLEENFRAIVEASRPGGHVDPRLRPAHIDSDVTVLGGRNKRAATGLSEGTGAYGGFFIDTQKADDLLAPMWETGVLLPRVKQYNITQQNANSVTFVAIDETDRGQGNRLGGLRLYTREEAGSVTASKPQWYEFEVKTKAVMAVCYFTEEQMQDTPGLVSLVQGYFQNEAGYEIDEYILNGDGASEPLGITNHDCLISASKETGQAADTVVAENFINMYARMPERNRRNAIWTYPANALPQMLQLSLDLGVTSVPLWLPGNQLVGQPYNSILNRPVVELEQAPTVGDANDIMFIDPTQYLLVRKGGARTDLSIHVQFLYGETVMRFMFRLGGASWWKSAITPANDGDTLGPFIGLAERA